MILGVMISRGFPIVLLICAGLVLNGGCVLLGLILKDWIKFIFTIGYGIAFPMVVTPCMMQSKKFGNNFVSSAFIATSSYALCILFWFIINDMLYSVLKSATVYTIIVGGISIGYAFVYFILSGKPQMNGGHNSDRLVEESEY
jgi:hypothetical protein